MKAFPIFLAVAGSVFAGEYAVLTDGSRIYAHGHENHGEAIVLHTENGTRELPPAEIASFEPTADLLLTSPPPALRGAAHAGWRVPLPEPPFDTQMLIQAAAEKHNVPAAVVKSIVAAESGFRPHAVSSKGAIGLMQLMPKTALALGADPHDPAENVDAGTRYLRILMDKYRHYRDSMRRVIAAYNAGPGAVDRHRGVPPYRETRTYVARVLALIKLFAQDPG
jgi:hypothetical protein